MKKYLCLILIALMFLSSCERIIDQNSSSVLDTSSSASSSEGTILNSSLVSEQNISESSSEEEYPDVEIRTKVDFKDIKEDLVGVYGIPVDFSPYLYEYIFWDNGEFLVFDWKSRKTFTKENSSIEYFNAIGPVLEWDDKGEAIIVSLTHQDGAVYELYLYVNEEDGKKSYGICPSDKLILLGKIDPVFKLNDWVERFSYFSLEDFDGVQVGVTTYGDLYGLLEGNYQIAITSEGNITQFPLENGEYVRVTFNTEYVITDLKVTNEFIKPYTLEKPLSYYNNLTQS